MLGNTTMPWRKPKTKVCNIDVLHAYLFATFAYENKGKLCCKLFLEDGA